MPRPLSAFERLFAALTVAVGSVFPVTYLWVVSGRLRYPYELEWMEGGTVVHLQRILDGLPLYAKPTIDFVAYIYTPGYFYVAAGLASLIGNGFLAPRIVSFVASLAVFAFLFLLVRRRTGSSLCSYLAVCLFAASFRVTGAWLDVARVDSLFLALLLAGLYAFETPIPSVRSLLAPILFFLAYFTKQQTLILALPLCGAAFLLRRGAERYLCGVILGALVVASTLLMNHWTDGWYDYYVFRLPREHGIDLSFNALIGLFWIRDMLGHVAIALCLCLVPFLERIALREWNGRLLVDACIAGGLLGMSWLSRIHGGGWDNVLLPVYAGVAIFFGIGVSRALSLLPDAPYRAGIWIAATLQLVALTYRPGLQVPSAEDRAVLERFIAQLAAMPGDVYLADHPWYKVLAGKPPQAHTQAVTDVLRGRAPEAMDREVSAAIRGGRYQAVICDFEDCGIRLSEITDLYPLSGEKLPTAVLEPVTGGRTRTPTYLYRRRAAD